ncbi:hypothetical protein NEFER03_1186 [Nematocida sp. LUAm3]|nr:hypothetical protein NEFER03_1186 [Nematocida sp. LUAm3]KAI5175795.1 hypothetical protein NEFER02_1664 [Nematocida sp. LUAm2]KAI5178291.1 hypothetical protein NEFER01_1458 [Nematocida sp. LUAm1]
MVYVQPFPNSLSSMPSDLTLETILETIGYMSVSFSIFSIFLVLMYLLNRKNTSKKETTTYIIGMLLCCASIAFILLLSQKTGICINDNQRFFVIGATAFSTSAYVFLRCNQFFRNISLYVLAFVFMASLIVLVTYNIHWVSLLFILLPLVCLEGNRFFEDFKKDKERLPFIFTIF